MGTTVMEATDNLPVIGIGRHWQDYQIGEHFRTVGRTITETELVTFINCTGMTEVMFNNLDYIEKHSAINARAVPGALVYATAEGLLIPTTMQNTGLAFLNMELNVERPTFVNDTIHVEVEVLEVREASKGNRGLVRTRNVVRDQNGETKIVYTPLRLVRGRE